MLWRDAGICASRGVVRIDSMTSRSELVYGTKLPEMEARVDLVWEVDMETENRPKRRVAKEPKERKKAIKKVANRRKKAAERRKVRSKQNEQSTREIRNSP